MRYATTAREHAKERVASYRRAQHTLNIEQLHLEPQIYIIKSDSSNCDIISEV
jgi:hypothetical protein